MSRQRLHVHGLKEASAGQLRQPPGVIAIVLVGRKRLERLIGLPALDADHGQTELAQPVKQDRRHASRLEHDPTTTRRLGQFVGDRLRSRLRLALVNHNAFAVENANMGLVHRDIEASKIVHRTVSSSTPWPIVSACAEELPPITLVEKPLKGATAKFSRLR